jgi:hypothetical protein
MRILIVGDIQHIGRRDICIGGIIYADAERLKRALYTGLENDGLCQCACEDWFDPDEYTHCPSCGELAR